MTEANERRVSPWVKAFVAFHLVAITSWSLPRPPQGLAEGTDSLQIRTESPARVAQSVGRLISDGTLLVNERYVKTSPLRVYLLATGFWQYWDMFSPNPARTDLYGTATVFYRDGSTRLYQYPRIYSMPLTRKYVSERYRKFYERAHMESSSALWPTFAQRVAFLSTDSLQNPPVKVVLRRHWLDIAPPGQPQPTDYKSYEYFTYLVDQAEIARAVKGP